jgi:hypothetical protein
MFILQINMLVCFSNFLPAVNAESLFIAFCLQNINMATPALAGTASQL